MIEKSNQEAKILSYKKELNLDFLHIKKMKLDKNRSGGHWLGYSVHFSSLVEFPRKSKIDLEKRTIHNASHDLRGQHTSLLISSIWGRQKVSEKKMWGWKHLGAIKLSSPTLNCKHWHYSSFKRSGNYDFKEKTIPLELWFRLWCNFYHWMIFCHQVCHYGLYSILSLASLSISKSCKLP